jgi:hypothetical protein
VRPEPWLPREALGLSPLREELREEEEDDGRLLLLREALGLSVLREELREEDDDDRPLLLPPEAEARPERLPLPRPEPREPLVSPAWARSLFTVRAAISSAVPSFLPRFS